MKLAETECSWKDDDDIKDLLLEIAEECYRPVKLLHILMEENPDKNEAEYYGGSIADDAVFLQYCAKFGMFNGKTLEIIEEHFGKEYIKATERNHTGHDTDFELEMAYGSITLNKMLENHKAHEAKVNKRKSREADHRENNAAHRRNELYIYKDTLFNDPAIIRTEAELADLLDNMPPSGSFCLFCFTDRAQALLPRMSVYAKEGKCVIVYMPMKNGSTATLAAYDPDMDETAETVWFFTNPEGDEVRFPASWIKTFAEVRECIMTFFKVKDRPPECLEWKLVGQTEGGNSV
jgi:hypothetical protein